jgi:Crp-like helix-turn-helix protein
MQISSSKSSKSSKNQEPHNLLLDALPDHEMIIFRDSGQKVVVHEGKILPASTLDAEWLFFPTTAVLSLMAMTRDGLTVETSLVGREGLVGLAPFFNQHHHTLECMVQHGGEVCQISADVVRRARLPTLHRLLLRYAGYHLSELAQAAVCNRFHLVRQRFSRWILTANDRTSKHEMDFTQEMLSAIVGARRPVVASLIGRMEDEGLIEYRRGCLAITNRAGLERAACECYGILFKAMTEFLTTVPFRAV